MDFSLSIDSGALVNLPDIKASDTRIRVTDTEVTVHFGPEFNATVSKSTIAAMSAMEDPRPTVYFPMGVSAAVDQLGRDTIAIVTSYKGLVRIDFDREVEAMTRPTNYTGKSATGEAVPVQFRHLILSLQNPDGFMQAARQRGAIASS